MSPEEIWSVQDSFAKLLASSDVVGEIFYQRLFDIAPEARMLFKGDLSKQSMKLMMALSMVVNNLSRFDAILPVAQKLGAAHVEFGVKPEYYLFVREALLDTLAERLSPVDFDDDVRSAWVKAYTLLSEKMIEAGGGERAAASM